MCILLVGFLGLLWHHHCRKISILKVCGLHIPEAHSLAFICCLSKVLISKVRSNLARWSFEWTVWVHHRWLTSGKVPNNIPKWHRRYHQESRKTSDFQMTSAWCSLHVHISSARWSSTCKEENDYPYDDLLSNEKYPPSSPTLQTLQELEFENTGFRMFIDFKEIEEDQNTQGPTTTSSNRRQDHFDHSSYIHLRQIHTGKHTRQV